MFNSLTVYNIMYSPPPPLFLEVMVLTWPQVILNWTQSIKWTHLNSRMSKQYVWLNKQLTHAHAHTHTDLRPHWSSAQRCSLCPLLWSMRGNTQTHVINSRITCWHIPDGHLHTTTELDHIPWLWHVPESEWQARNSCTHNDNISKVKKWPSKNKVHINNYFVCSQSLTLPSWRRPLLQATPSHIWGQRRERQDWTPPHWSMGQLDHRWCTAWHCYWVSHQLKPGGEKNRKSASYNNVNNSKVVGLGTWPVTGFPLPHWH